VSNWLGVIEGVVAGTVPVVGLIYTYLANRRGQYDRVLTLAAESGLPPVAEDRHVAGMAFEPMTQRLPGQGVRLSAEEIKAAYNVLWYFERVDALYRSLRPAARPNQITRTQALLLDSLGSALHVWTGYFGLSWVDEAGQDVGTDDTSGPLQHLAIERGRLTARRARQEARIARGRTVILRTTKVTRMKR
jgi:hypothetical protein